MNYFEPISYIIGVSFHSSLSKKKENFVTFLSTLWSKAIDKSQDRQKITILL